MGGISGIRLNYNIRGRKLVAICHEGNEGGSRTTQGMMQAPWTSLHKGRPASTREGQPPQGKLYRFRPYRCKNGICHSPPWDKSPGYARCAGSCPQRGLGQRKIIENYEGKSDDEL